MTTSPPLDLTTRHPAQRADALTQYASHQDDAGHPDSARLARLAADTERLLADPDAEPTTVDDPAWDEDDWWTLASTTNRSHRAELLERLWRDWALPNFGDDADILLEIARSERATHALSTLSPLQDDRPAIHDRVEPMGADDALDPSGTAPRDDSPSPAMREVRQTHGKGVLFVVLALLSIAAIAVVAIPTTPWEAKLGAAVTLTVVVLLWLARMMRGPGR